MEQTLYPALKAAPEGGGPIDLRSMVAQALHMGDECHNRNKAGTSLFIRTIAPALIEAVRDAATVAAVLRFIDGNDHFFLNLSMPAMKAMLLPAENIPGCTVVTVMARNGTDWGIRISATGDRWFTAPAPLGKGCGCPVSPRPMPIRTSATARSPRRAGSAALRWRARQSSSSSSAAHLPTR